MKTSQKGKRKAPESDDEDDDDADSDASGMDVDEDADTPTEIVAMPESGGIQALRDKLHARMTALRRGGGGAGWARGDEPGSRDELLEERRKQRGAMRERRRKETKEKIRREEERRGKGKEKEKGKEAQRDKGPTTKVRRGGSGACVHYRTYFPDATSGSGAGALVKIHLGILRDGCRSLQRWAIWFKGET